MQRSVRLVAPTMRAARSPLSRPALSFRGYAEEKVKRESHEKAGLVRICSHNCSRCYPLSVSLTCP